MHETLCVHNQVLPLQDDRSVNSEAAQHTTDLNAELQRVQMSDDHRQGGNQLPNLPPKSYCIPVSTDHDLVHHRLDGMLDALLPNSAHALQQVRPLPHPSGSSRVRRDLRSTNLTAKCASWFSSISTPSCCSCSHPLPAPTNPRSSGCCNFPARLHILPILSLPLGESIEPSPSAAERVCILICSSSSLILSPVLYSKKLLP